MRLLIDTSNETCIVVFYDEEKIVYQANIPKGINNTKYVAQEIDTAFKLLNTSPQYLKYIALGVGPGSYTGIRVGVTIAKVFSYTFNLPIVQLCSLDGFIPSINGKFISIIDAKSGGAYYRVGERNESIIHWITEPRLSELDKIEWLKSIETLLSPDSRLLKPKIEKIYGKEYNWVDATPNISYLIKLAEERFIENKTVTHDQVEILYLRETQAEIELKKQN